MCERKKEKAGNTQRQNETEERKQQKECAHNKKRNLETGKRSVEGMDAKQEHATSMIFSANDLRVRVCGGRVEGGGWGVREGVMYIHLNTTL